MEKRRFTFLDEPDKSKTRFFKIRNFHNKGWVSSKILGRQLGNSPLRDQYPQLYNLVRKKQDTVANVLSTQIPNISWRKDLVFSKLVMWNNLVSRLSTIVLSQERDDFKWNLDRTGVFSVKSHYLGLINQNIPNLNKSIWKLKAPLKIKIFLWYLRQGVILTKDNLAKCNWQGNQQ